jgi:dolichol-phosphate mannosyltransferase
MDRDATAALSSPPPEISIVIPVYNEEENLTPLLAALTETMVALGTPYELLFIDDGSADGTTQVLRTMCGKHPEVHIVRLRHNAGQTAALDAGFKRARGQVVVTLDGDLQNDPRDIPRLLAKLQDYEVVCGVRQRRQDTWWRRVSSMTANAIRRRVLRDDIADIGCSLRAYRRHCLESIKLYHGMHRFLPALLHMEGYRVAQIPVNHHPRQHGRSKYNARNRAWRALMDLLAVRWMKSRQLRYEIVDAEAGAMAVRDGQC